MIAACPHVAATPMIRLPDAQEWHIQHSTDIGALGVIVPTVDDVDRAREGAKWARFPPVGRRSSGQGQAPQIWGIQGVNYRQTINDNMLVTIMIETPTGVANAYDIASVPGVDVVIIGNNDLASFSGYAQGTPEYQALMTKVHDDVLRAGKIFGQANAMYATGNPLSKDAKFFQNGPSNDGYTPPGRGGRGANPNAPPPGEEVTPPPPATKAPPASTTKK
jgi:2-keto-3-deoxy-L-rhamnonate aldolase RhmA